MTRRPFRLAAGLLALVTAVVGSLALAGAEEGQGPVTITRQAYFTHPFTEAAPPLLLNGFPPNTLCLVGGLAGAPQVCGEEVARVGQTLGFSDGLPTPTTPDGDVAQPVTPGTSPVGMLGGQQRWVSLFQLGVPSPPEGQQYGSFEFVLHQDGLNYAAESPAFRAAVFAAISQVQAHDPALFRTLVEDLADGSVPAYTQTITGIEACVVTEAWNGGDAQSAGLDGSRIPDSNCLIGAAGVYDPVARTFTFDLTFAAQAWTTGDFQGNVLPNEGIVLRPVGAPNLAYGDPDFSTNWLVSLADGEAAPALRPKIKFSTVPALDTGFGELDDSSGDISLDPGETLTTGEFIVDTGTDSISPGVPTGGPTIIAGGPISARWGDRKSAFGGSLGWLWLLIPVLLGTALLFGESLHAAPVAGGQRRPGAMSRLMDLREGK